MCGLCRNSLYACVVHVLAVVLHTVFFAEVVSVADVFSVSQNQLKARPTLRVYTTERSRNSKDSGAKTPKKSPNARGKK